MAKNLTEEERLNKRRRHHFYAPAGQANYAELNAERLMRSVAIIAKNGGAVRFGHTRDGGAYAIGIYGDGSEPYTDYLRPTDDVIEYLESIAQSFVQLPTT